MQGLTGCSMGGFGHSRPGSRQLLAEANVVGHTGGSGMRSAGTAPGAAGSGGGVEGLRLEAGVPGATLLPSSGGVGGVGSGA